MIQRALALIFKRATERDEIPLPFLIGNLVSSVVLASVWLAPVDGANITNVILSSFVAALAETPILMLYALVAKHAPNRITKLILLNAILLGASFIFYWSFTALLAGNYLEGFNGLDLAVFNHALTVLNCYAVYSFISGSIVDHRVVKLRYINIRRESEVFSNQSEVILTAATEQIKRQVQHALVPAVNVIRKNLKSSSIESTKLAQRLELMLSDIVRPLSFEIRQSIEADMQVPAANQIRIPVWGSIPGKFNPRSSFSATFTTWLFVPMLISSTSSFTPLRFNLELLFDLFILWLLLLIARPLLPQRKVHWALAFACQQALVWLSLIAVSIYSWLFVTSDSFPLKFVVQVGILVSATTLLFAFAYNTEWARSKAAASADGMARDLQRAKDIFGQHLWISKRNWSYLIHGKVQSHILAAKIMSQQAEKSARSFEGLEQHLNSVIDALANPPIPDVDLEKEFLDLQATWRGIASIYLDFEGASVEIVKNDANLRFAINEILRESVSNAVKHGNANEIFASLEVEGDHLLLKIANSGELPSKRTGSNFGSEMFKELTSKWSIKFDRKSNKVVLRALLPY
jgi:hypothetical protein